MLWDQIEDLDEVVCVHCECVPMDLPYMDDWRMTEFGCECPSCQKPPDANAEPMSIESMNALVNALYKPAEPAVASLKTAMDMAALERALGSRPRVSKRIRRST
jgi:hypothetical protein